MILRHANRHAIMGYYTKFAPADPVAAMLRSDYRSSGVGQQMDALSVLPSL
jgi:hypothetical protein